MEVCDSDKYTNLLPRSRIMVESARDLGLYYKSLRILNL